jgi:hypothetical protein
VYDGIKKIIKIIIVQTITHQHPYGPSKTPVVCCIVSIPLELWLPERPF